MPEVDQLLQDQANTEDGPAMPGREKCPADMDIDGAFLDMKTWSPQTSSSNWARV